MNGKHLSDSARRISSHLRDAFHPRKETAGRLKAFRSALEAGGDLIANKKRIVTVGGGTGTFVVLSALRDLPDLSLAAIVSVADDGGSTGRLRDAYGFLPVGDARQALVALAKEGTMIRDLFTYRFSKGDIAGHNLGNLLLTALTDRLGSDAEAIRAASDILRVRGRVVPVSDSPATLIATLESGETVVGQHKLNRRPPGGSPIQNLGVDKEVALSKEAHDVIGGADVIVLGPGDLYTSTLANFAVPGLKGAVASSPARLVYFMNLFTTAAETEGYTASRHIEEISRYTGRAPDVVALHTGSIPDEILDYYARKGAYPVVDDLGAAPSVVRGSIADVVKIPKVEGDVLERSLIRHDPKKVAEIIEHIL